MDGFSGKRFWDFSNCCFNSTISSWKKHTTASPSQFSFQFIHLSIFLKLKYFMTSEDYKYSARVFWECFTQNKSLRNDVLKMFSELTHSFNSLLQCFVVGRAGASADRRFLRLFPRVGFLLLGFCDRRNLLLILLLGHLLKAVIDGLRHHACKHRRNQQENDTREQKNTLWLFHNWLKEPTTDLATPHAPYIQVECNWISFSFYIKTFWFSEYFKCFS